MKRGKRAAEAATLSLGVRMAEVEALYSGALTAETAADEAEALRELARAARLLSALAEVAAESAGEPAGMTVPPAGRVVVAHPSTLSAKPRVRRRIARTQHTVDWIITRSRPDPH
ncbi:hypothetical protein [Actinomadura oligospora]|uniref:hypothetical protein n=1 Tax=Actinomadura oligospora TaxID=111804 RepID=UPI00047C44C3|nr:hypothetical protein [Actinomadura oligospora]